MEEFRGSSEYVPSNLTPDDFEKTDGVILSYLSDKVLLSNIQEQIESPILSEKQINYLNIFEERYSLLMDKHGNDPDLANRIKFIRMNTLMEIVNLIETKFDLTTNLNLETSTNLDIINISKSLYHVFTLNYKENIKDLFINYIINNSNEYYEQYKDKLNKKDISKINKGDRSDVKVVLMSTTFDSVNEISCISDNDSVIELFLETDSEEYHHNILINAYETGELSPKNDFCSNIFKALEDEDFKMTLVNDIKFAIYKSSL